MALHTPDRQIIEINPADVQVLFHDYIAARIIRKSAFQGRFFVPQEFREKTRLAKVLNTGCDYDGPVQKGDIILYGAWEGKEWPMSPDDSIILLSPDNVKAIVTP